MRAPRLTTALLLALAPALPVHGDTTTVQFIEPGRYIDAGNHPAQERRNLNTLESHLRALGSRCLTRGEKLELSIRNVDLAGRNEWWHRNQPDLRVMREVDWPRIELDYTLRDAGGTLLGEGSEQVTDMNYLLRAGARRNRSDPLAYDKAMLTDWFNNRFCPGEVATSAP